jgi:hypothetical protein
MRPRALTLMRADATVLAHPMNSLRPSHSPTLFGVGLIVGP